MTSGLSASESWVFAAECSCSSRWRHAWGSRRQRCWSRVLSAPCASHLRTARWGSTSPRDAPATSRTRRCRCARRAGRTARFGGRPPHRRQRWVEWKEGGVLRPGRALPPRAAPAPLPDAHLAAARRGRAAGTHRLASCDLAGFGGKSRGEVFRGHRVTRTPGAAGACAGCTRDGEHRGHWVRARCCATAAEVRCTSPSMIASTSSTWTSTRCSR